MRSCEWQYGQIGRFLKFLCNKFNTQVAQMFGDFWTTFWPAFGKTWSTFLPHSHPNGFYWSHQCSWTFTPANSIWDTFYNNIWSHWMQHFDKIIFIKCRINFKCFTFRDLNVFKWTVLDVFLAYFRSLQVDSNDFKTSAGF